MTLTNKLCLITGATAGIGKEAAKELSKMGVTLIMPVRNMEKGEEVKKEIITFSGNDRIELYYCDFSSLATVKKFTESFRKKHDRLDILINNAGLWATKFEETKDGIEKTLAVNHLGPFLLTNLLLDVIKKSAHARIVNVSSSAHQLGKMNFNDLEGRKKFSWTKIYGQSKLANILFTRKLAIMLKDDGITVNCLHPGAVKTNLFDEMSSWFRKMINWMLISVEKGAQTTIFLASSPDVEKISGEYFAKKKIHSTTSSAKNMADADKLWEVSMTYVKKFM